MKPIEVFDKIKKEISKVIVGNEKTLKFLFLNMVCGGHSIIEGVPGLAKTMIVNALAKTLSLEFNRIQFTPDLMPSDITGTEVIDFTKDKKEFTFLKGPIFANIVLADEINRTPPKTQSALLQAMQEKKVTILGKTYELPEPFFVFATQNPIEYQGTYPLPEAQLDRFLFKIDLNYPSREEEKLILSICQEELYNLKEVVKKKDLISLQSKVKEVYVADKVKEYIVEITRNSRPPETDFSIVKEFISWGAGPRASQMLFVAGRANALINGKDFVDKIDIDEVILPVLKHRIFLNYRATSEHIRPEDIILEIKKEVEKRI
ncbi:MAG: MoxR family ATPase [Brevinematales bacterium]|nr:MoxR family ATPase [Brevinematales bacterium]